MAHGTCSLPECDSTHYSRGLCRIHYVRNKRHGDPRGSAARRMPTPDWDRFWAKVEKTDGCWRWTAATIHDGRGRFNLSNPKRVGYAYRIAYEWLVGPVPEGLELDHLCRNPNCVNPAHLEPVTHQENLRRAPDAQFYVNARKTHCPRRHEYTVDNTGWSKRWTRYCKACTREKWHERQARKRAA
jgi:hypothetical protein